MINYSLEKIRLHEILNMAEHQLFTSKRFKFKKCTNWRKENVPDQAGVYILFENEENILYIGESGNLRDRMNEINRTVNHSFRKQIGYLKYNGIKSKKKFTEEIEIQLDEYFDSNLYASFLPVNFGRLEIETYLITKYQKDIINSIKKRKEW